MKVEELAEYKEKMLYAKNIGDEDCFKKYYSLFCNAYKQITGKDFEELLQKNESDEDSKIVIDEVEIPTENDEQCEGIDR